MIISASRRTDLPSFYGDWFRRRLREGFVRTRNPFRADQVRELSLLRGDVDCFVFWTKDPAPFLPVLEELDAAGYPYYFQFTLTPYGRDLEPGLRDKADLADTLCRLGARIGRERVRWRYDPIILDEGMDIPWHRKRFAQLCGRLAPFAESVTISFVDQYKKLRTRFSPIAPGEMLELAGFFSAIAGEQGLSVAACCEALDLTAAGVGRAACVDGDLVRRITGKPLPLKRDGGQRTGCGCAASADIGAYNTCSHGCLYCYANHSPAAVARNRDRHDPASPFLLV